MEYYYEQNLLVTYDKFKNIITKVDNLKEFLINIFSKYYGVEHITHIKNTIQNINFVYTYLNRVIGASKNFSIEDIEIIKNKIKKESQYTDTHVFCYTEFNPPIINLDINLVENNLDLHRIIHEINHALHANLEEKQDFSYLPLLSSIMNTKREKLKIGISEKATNNEILYEIFNEYMTYEILSIINNINSETYNLDLNIKSCFYLSIDKLLNGEIKNIFQNLKEDIKNNLINLTPTNLFNIIDEELYVDVCNSLNDLYMKYIDFYNFCIIKNLYNYDENIIINVFKEQNKDIIDNEISKLINLFNTGLGTKH